MRPSSDSRSCSARRSAHAETWANLGADFIAIEAQKLVGGASAKPEVISSAVEQIRAVNPRVPVLFGAGVKTGRDVREETELGTTGGRASAAKPRGELGATVSVPSFTRAGDSWRCPRSAPSRLTSMSQHIRPSPIPNRMDHQELRVMGTDEEEGLLDPGRVDRLHRANASLLIR